MNFGEKLIELRKKAGLSQEQLAENLNVTRQTVSKWELGQSKPDMDKLTQMSIVFNISIDDLINDTKLDNKVSNQEKTKKKSNRKFILWICIILFIASIATLSYRILMDIERKKDDQKSFFFGIFDNITDTRSNFNIKSFNNSFEVFAGTKSKMGLESRMNDLITSNKTNSEHLIELIFDNISYGTDEAKIKEIKNSLKDDLDYELSFDYDEDGYINKFIVESKVNVSQFNFGIGSSTGWTYGTSLSDRMLKLISSNQKYPNHLIELVFDGVSYGTDIEAIKSKKNSLDEWTKYEVSLEYDEQGYINKFIVETK